jgi:hypothetical protein
LAQNNASLNGLAQTDLICQQNPFGQWRLQGKQCRLNLVRVQVNTGIEQGLGEPADIVGTVPPGQLVSKILGVEGCDHDPELSCYVSKEG